jgi:hypothetical protein
MGRRPLEVRPRIRRRRDVTVGWLLWTARGTIHNVVLVAIFFPILLPVALLDWLRRCIGRPQRMEAARQTGSSAGATEPLR